MNEALKVADVLNIYKNILFFFHGFKLSVALLQIFIYGNNSLNVLNENFFEISSKPPTFG